MSAEMKKQRSGGRAAPMGALRSTEWVRVLEAGVRAQRLVPGAICVGGTAAALYAGHRISHDTDHVLPTLDELVCMKAFLAYDRNATRDYLDFAALAECAPPEATLRSLLKLEARYGGLQSASVALEVAKALSAAAPFDLDEAELPHYKGLARKWHRWETTRDICRRFGLLLGDALIRDGN